MGYIYKFILSRISGDLLMNKLISYINQHYTKAIGWGTSSYYHKFSKMLNVELAYLIDSDVNKCGKVLDNKIIYSPDILAKEEPENVLIIVFSIFYNEIYDQIQKYGDFYVISGTDILDLDYIFNSKGQPMT